MFTVILFGASQLADDVMVDARAMLSSVTVLLVDIVPTQEPYVMLMSNVEAILHDFVPSLL